MPGTRLRQMREGSKRLLEVVHGLAVGRPRQGLLPSLPAVCHGLVPYLAVHGVVCQAVHLLGQPLRGEYFKDLDKTGVQGAPPCLQETAVGHLLCQGMLEGMDLCGEEPRLGEKCGGL